MRTKYRLSKQEAATEIKTIISIINRHQTDLWPHEMTTYNEVACINRKQTYYYPRMICSHLLRNHDYYYMSLQSMADMFGLKTHASIINAIESCQNIIETNRLFAEYYERIKAAYYLALKTNGQAEDVACHDAIVLLEKLGYYYIKTHDKFWSAEYECFVSIPISWCTDLEKVFNVIIMFEKEKAVNKALNDNRPPNWEKSATEIKSILASNKNNSGIVALSQKDYDRIMWLTVCQFKDFCEVGETKY